LELGRNRWFVALIFEFDIIGSGGEPLTLGIMTKKRLIISALVSVVLAMPMGGFVYGFITAPVSEYYNLIGRGVGGVEFAILTTVCLGFPPEALEDQAQPINVWPYIIISCLIIFGICTAFAYHKSHPKPPT